MSPSSSSAVFSVSSNPSLSGSKGADTIAVSALIGSERQGPKPDLASRVIEFRGSTKVSWPLVDIVSLPDAVRMGRPGVVVSSLWCSKVLAGDEDDAGAGAGVSATEGDTVETGGSLFVAPDLRGLAGGDGAGRLE